MRARLRQDLGGIPALGPRGEGWVLIQTILLVGVVVAEVVGARWPENLLVPALVIAIISGEPETGGARDDRDHQGRHQQVLRPPRAYHFGDDYPHEEDRLDEHPALAPRAERRDPSEVLTQPCPHDDPVSAFSGRRRQSTQRRHDRRPEARDTGLWIIGSPHPHRRRLPQGEDGGSPLGSPED